MPELPEVESIARSLVSGQDGGPTLIGARVEKARVAWKRTIAQPSAALFQKRVLGQQVLEVGRRAKFIKIQLEKDTLLVHLRMSGDLLLAHSEAVLGAHSRMQLYFRDGLQLSFNDPRKFGRVWLVADTEAIFGGLGPEPFDPELTPARFHEMLRTRKRQLKPLLLDQTFLAGLGNIYADESLYLSRLHPLTSSADVTEEQAAELLNAIRAVLAEGIRRNGASIDWVYRGGEFQNYFNAYQKDGTACPRCGTKIARIVLGQRSTHFCPKCQKLPKVKKKR
jgi:formamidopyrimidine-DNA glycosylase